MLEKMFKNILFNLGLYHIKKIQKIYLREIINYSVCEKYINFNLCKRNFGTQIQCFSGLNFINLKEKKKRQYFVIFKILKYLSKEKKKSISIRKKLFEIYI